MVTGEQVFALVALAPVAVVALVALLRGYYVSIRLDRHRDDDGPEDP